MILKETLNDFKTLRINIHMTGFNAISNELMPFKSITYLMDPVLWHKTSAGYELMLKSVVEMFEAALPHWMRTDWSLTSQSRCKSPEGDLRITEASR